jgi:hypothetical protein
MCCFDLCAHDSLSSSNTSMASMILIRRCRPSNVRTTTCHVGRNRHNTSLHQRQSAASCSCWRAFKTLCTMPSVVKVGSKVQTFDRCQTNRVG